ncbi:hypothetical protein [Amedibacillus sp. YH-ame10]
MKKLLTAFFCATMVFGLTGCGASREPLDTEGVKKNLSNAGFKFTCVTSDGDYGCLFSDGDKDFMYMELFGVVYHTDDNAYSIENKKMIDGDGDETKLKEEYTKILKDADVKEEELISSIKSEFKSYKTKADKEKEEAENKEYKAGERASIESNGEEIAAITFNSATATDERNRFDDSGAQQVVMLNYTIENINSEDSLYLSSVSMTVIGDDGSTASTYPVSGEYAQRCPKGAKSTGDEAYGFKTPTTKAKVIVEMYINSEKVTRTFHLDVH